MSWSHLDHNNPADDAVIGDDPFDLVADCFREVTRAYLRDWKRKPSLRELIGTVQAVLEAQIQDHTSDGESAELVKLSFRIRKIPKRQKYQVGDVLVAEAANGKPVYGRIFEIHPSYGPLVGVYDSIGMARTEVDAILSRPVIVKAFPIHREILQKRGWLVIGHRPISNAERNFPRGPVQIAGHNEQLESANYVYGFVPRPFYNVEECILRKPAKP